MSMLGSAKGLDFYEALNKTILMLDWKFQYVHKGCLKYIPLNHQINCNSTMHGQKQHGLEIFEVLKQKNRILDFDTE